MIELKEMQFELLRGDTSGEGVAFGFGLPVAVNEDGFDTGELSWITQDSQNPVTGNSMYGRDTPGSNTWTFAMHADAEDAVGALAAVAELAAAWRATGVVDKAGNLLPLRYRVGGRIRRVFGRPRRFAAPPDNRIIGGSIPVTASFDIVDSLHYDDDEQTAVLNFNADSDGGFILPAVLPISTLPGSDRSVSIRNAGDAPTAPVIRFDGPILNPYVQGPGWTVSLDLNLASGEWAVVDARPWRMTVLKNGTAGMGGRLGKRQYLTDVRLDPGIHNLRFGGQSSSALATCKVSWRNAYSSL